MPGAGRRASAAAAAVALLLLVVAPTQAARLPHQPRRPAAPVVLTVDQSPGKGDYTTIPAAINVVPANAAAGALIRISPGTYRQAEKVVVNKRGVSLVGTGPSATSTVVTWKAPWSNISLYEFPLFVQLQASDFVARRITFQNTLGKKQQAVAARVDGDKAARVDGDKAAFYDCRFLSHQDTLLDAAGRHYYHGCYILPPCHNVRRPGNIRTYQGEC